MISEELLNIIVCPETKQDLVLADSEIIEKINSLIEKGYYYGRFRIDLVIWVHNYCCLFTYVLNP